MILLLSTSDTDLITASASGAEYRVANPARILVDDLAGLADGADLVVIRILGGVRAWGTVWPRPSRSTSRWWCCRGSSSPTLI